MSDEKKTNKNHWEEESPLDKTSVVPSDTFKVRLAQAGEAPPCLVLLVGPANMIGRQWPLQSNNMILGRTENANVHVEDKSISKSHAKFIISGGEVSIIDLESTNKTVVNGRLIPSLQPIVLGNNDQIKTGNVIFKFLEKGNIETVSAAETFGRGMLDPLTGINNKGAFESHADESFRKAELLGTQMCIITFDIDHFKKVNDTHGHSAGDYILKELVTLVKNTQIRGNDFFARTGGEEFCLLLMGSKEAEARDVAERIRIKISSHAFEFQGIKMPITVSLGISSKNESDRRWQEIFDRADKALYASKYNGRNQVSVFGESK